MLQIPPEIGKQLNQEMRDTLIECASILDVRGKDYGDDNFANAAEFASMMTGKEFTRFDAAVVLLGIKFARYGNIMKGSRRPAGESILDTVRDAVNYIVLADRERQKDDYEKGIYTEIRGRATTGSNNPEERKESSTL